MAQTGGLGAEPTDFYGFHIKSTHLSTLFIEKGRTVPAVGADFDR